MKKRAVITGAFSFTGAAVARELINRGWNVHTLTNREKPPETKDISSSPLMFDLEYLKSALAGADVFINTYWVRFPWQQIHFKTAVDHTQLLIRAIVETNIPRLVHVSVSKADKGTNLGYFRAKHMLENIVSNCGISYAIVRPTLIVGPNDVLTNNIAWFLRRFPFFPVPSGGRYQLQPITLADTARIIVDAAESNGNLRMDAAGPDTMTFREFVKSIAQACGCRRHLLDSPDWFALGALRLAGAFLNDVILAKEELLGLQQGLLCSDEPAAGKQSVVDWMVKNADGLGRTYANDIQRHFGAGSTKSILDPTNKF